MKHGLTVEQRLTGARRAVAKLERMGPRYRGLVAGIRKNIRNLEEYRARGFKFMPYKDRETYLRKQREFYALRKARAKQSGVNTQISLTPANSNPQKTNSRQPDGRLLVSGQNGPLRRVSYPLLPKCPSTPVTPMSSRAKVENRASVASVIPRGINKPTAKERFQVDDCGNAWRIVSPDRS